MLGDELALNGVDDFGEVRVANLEVFEGFDAANVANQVVHVFL